MDILMYVILGLFGLSCCYNLCMSIWSSFDHCKWEKSARPSADAKIVDIDTKQVRYIKNGAKFRTDVKFSDGFVFITHETKREDKAFSYNISVDSEIMKWIISAANEAHQEAVSKKQGR